MRKYLKHLLLIIILGNGVAFAQSKAKLQLDVSQAVQYALDNNLTVQNSTIDEDIARKKILASIATGLPQINADASLSENIKLPTMVIDGHPITMGKKINAGAGLEVSQLIYNGSYFVGVQTAKLYKELTKKQSQKTHIEIAEAVVKLYYLILINEQSINILEKNKANINTLYENTKDLAKVGMAESIDVDQFEVQVIAMDNAIRAMNRTLEVNYNMLRFQLGLELGVELELISDINILIDNTLSKDQLSKDFDIYTHIDYQLMNYQEAMSEKKIELEKAAFQPTVAGFYQYNKNWLGDNFSNMNSFPSSVVGVQLNMPIFSSGERSAKVKQAKLELEKVRNSRQLLEEQLSIEYRQGQYDLRNAVENYEAQLNNVSVTQRVFDNITLKYNQGMVSSLDVTQANNNYLASETEMINAKLELLNTSLNMDRISNNLSMYLHE